MPSRRKPLGADTARDRLRRLLDEQTYVRLLRTPKYSDDLDGFVVGVGRKWALLQTTRDGGYFDGWNAFRISDVHQLRAQNESFQRLVSKKQTAWPPTPPRPIDLGRTADLLCSLSDEPLIGIEKERRRSVAVQQCGSGGPGPSRTAGSSCGRSTHERDGTKQVAATHWEP